MISYCDCKHTASNEEIISECTFFWLVVLKTFAIGRGGGGGGGGRVLFLMHDTFFYSFDTLHKAEKIR